MPVKKPFPYFGVCLCDQLPGCGANCLVVEPIAWLWGRLSSLPGGRLESLPHTVVFCPTNRLRPPVVLTPPCTLLQHPFPGDTTGADQSHWRSADINYGRWKFLVLPSRATGTSNFIDQSEKLNGGRVFQPASQTGINDPIDLSEKLRRHFPERLVRALAGRIGAGCRQQPSRLGCQGLRYGMRRDANANLTRVPVDLRQNMRSRPQNKRKGSGPEGLSQPFGQHRPFGHRLINRLEVCRNQGKRFAEFPALDPVDPLNSQQQPGISAQTIEGFCRVEDDARLGKVTCLRDRVFPVPGVPD